MMCAIHTGPEWQLLVGRPVAVEDLHVVQHVLQAGGLDRLVLNSQTDVQSLQSSIRLRPNLEGLQKEFLWNSHQ